VRARLTGWLAALGLGRLARRMLGARRAEALRDRIRWGRISLFPGLDRSAERSQQVQAALDAGPLGVNLVGYLTTESGLGEAARSSLRALQAARIPVSGVTLDNPTAQRQADCSALPAEAGFRYPINLIHLNPEPMPEAMGRFDPDTWQSRYNIGYWAWELERFPEEWQGAFSCVDEVWVPSEFTSYAVAAAAPAGLPVTAAPHTVEVREFGALPAEAAALPDDLFTFLFIFDYYSYPERKHPLAVVEAFRRAFPGDERVHLVLKTTDPARNPAYHRRLLEACPRGRSTVIARYLDRPTVNALLRRGDCYVSLHRAEGFGLTMAEAMYLGKPVIATGYSGNLEFMTEQNSLLAPYRLVEITEEHGPYRPGGLWAEPELEAAARMMRKVWEDRDLAVGLGKAAQATIQADFSPLAIGQRMAARLREVRSGSVNFCV